MFWNFIFYGMIAVGAILFVSLTIYRIDWARHPEKYKDLVEDEDPQKAEYRKKKEADKKAAAQKAKEKEKQQGQQILCVVIFVKSGNTLTHSANSVRERKKRMQSLEKDRCHLDRIGSGRTRDL